MSDYGPDHWETLYREGRTPWDVGGVPADLDHWLVDNGGDRRALIPGCGSGYEAVRLAAAGYAVLAIDFSAAAAARAHRITRGSGACVTQGDFFALRDTGFDLIYERAFLCALPPERRLDWAVRMAGLLKPGGQLAGFFFIDTQATDGPPFGVGQAALTELLEPAFDLVMDRPARDSLPVFAGRERWQVWRRNAFEAA